ncbi:MAG: Phosphate acetyltransferase [Syntrophaceae bacterium PtaB.Bin095]|jgi:BioD-like phosphotransacetylase family protein|nr:MAG: Phosphate acetyltransferase [Syntrophaceae bacterium PtaB.Bin095]
MDKFVVTSVRQGAGKTSLIIGLAKALNRKTGYMKPFGARLLYKKKRLWDYDAALMAHVFDLDEAPEDMSIGFHHSRLLYSLDEESTRVKLLEAGKRICADKDVLFVEAGKDILYGAAIYLDAITMTRTLEGQLLVIVGGDEDSIIDDLAFLAKHIRLDGIRFKGVVINKVADTDNFNDVYLPRIRQIDLPVLGVIPVIPELNYFSAGYLAERMFAKVLAGESGLSRQVRNIVVGSMGGGEAMKSPLFQDHHQVVVASGDRSDLILMSLQNNAAAVILTNNILPSPVILAKAESLGIPLLLVSMNTHETAKRINQIEPLPTKDDAEKIDLIAKMVRDHVDLKAVAPKVGG